MICPNPSPIIHRKAVRGFAPSVLARPLPRKTIHPLTEEQEDARDAKAALQNGKFEPWPDVKRELGL